MIVGTRNEGTPEQLQMATVPYRIPWYTGTRRHVAHVLSLSIIFGTQATPVKTPVIYIPS